MFGKTIVRCLLVTAMVVVVADGAMADTFTTGYINLYGTGLNSSMETSVANNPVTISFSGLLELAGSASVTSYGGNVTAVATFVSEATIRSSNGSLGVYCSGSGNGDWGIYTPRGGGEAWVQWQDACTLRARTGGTLPLPSTPLFLNYEMSGEGGVTYNSSDGGTKRIFKRYRTGLGIDSQRMASQFV